MSSALPANASNIHPLAVGFVDLQSSVDCGLWSVQVLVYI